MLRMVVESDVKKVGLQVMVAGVGMVLAKSAVETSRVVSLLALCCCLCSGGGDFLQPDQRERADRERVGVG